MVETGNQWSHSGFMRTWTEDETFPKSIFVGFVLSQYIAPVLYE